MPEPKIKSKHYYAREHKNKAREERVLKELKKDPREIYVDFEDEKMKKDNLFIGKCHGFLDLDCKSCIAALKERLGLE